MSPVCRCSCLLTHPVPSWHLLLRGPNSHCPPLPPGPPHVSLPPRPNKPSGEDLKVSSEKLAATQLFQGHWHPDPHSKNWAVAVGVQVKESFGVPWPSSALEVEREQQRHTWAARSKIRGDLYCEGRELPRGANVGVASGHTGHSRTIFSPPPSSDKTSQKMTEPQTPAQGGATSHKEPSDCQDSFLERRLEQTRKQREGPRAAPGDQAQHRGPGVSSPQGPCSADGRLVGKASPHKKGKRKGHASPEDDPSS